MSSETTLSSPVDSSLAAIMKHLEQGNLETGLAQLVDPKNGLPPSLTEAIQKKLRLSMERDIKEASQQYVATLSASKPASKVNALFNLPICRHVFSFINTGKVEDKVKFAAACKHFELAVATAKFFAEQEKKGSTLDTKDLMAAKDDDPQNSGVTNLIFGWAENKEDFAQLIKDHPKICSQVKGVTVTGSTRFTNTLPLLAKFPALRSLDIQYNGDVRIDDTILKQIVESCPSLRNFNFTPQSQRDVQISKDGFMLMEKFPFLQSLAINSKALVATPKLPNLRKFSVYGEKGDFKNLIEFLKMHPKLTELTLWGIGLTDDKLAEIVKVAPQLTALNLIGRGELTQKGLSALAGLRQLTSIGFKGNFGDSDIIALGSICPKLQQAYFPNCEIPGAGWNSPVKKISDEAVIAFANKFPNLIFLELGNSDITTKSLEHLAKQCPKLHSVGILWCNKLPKEPGKYAFKLVNHNWLKNL